MSVTSSGFRAFAAAAVLAFAPPASGDDVVLKNGRSFESVIVVTETEETVRIRLPYGELSLPSSWVESVVRQRTPLDEFLRRRQRMERDPEAGAAEWLELAVWARTHELEHGYRESVLAAAEIDPRLVELKVHMRRIDRVFDEELDRWIPYEESRRGERVERRREEEIPVREARRESREERDSRATLEERLGSALEALAVAELERERRETDRQRSSSFDRAPRTVFHVPFRQAAVYPVAIFPGFARVPVAQQEDPRSGDARKRDAYSSLRRRQPGSLLVSRSGSRSVGSLAGMRRQPGSLALNSP